jgi:C-terminal processing protease CtpA/Prc
MKKLTTLSLLSILVAGLACKDKSSGLSGEYAFENNWMQVNMEYYYFWNEFVREDVDGELLPEEYFESLLNPDDKFSFIVDNATEFLADLNGRSYTAGYSPGFGTISETDSIFIVVEFIYPETSAETAGLKRGDIIMEIDGEQLLRSNYLDLYNTEGSSTLTLGEVVRDTVENKTYLRTTDRTVTVTNSLQTLDPVVYTDILEVEGKRVGYMFYSRFLTGEDAIFLESVNQTLESFEQQNIDELVIDLRYNPGGSINSATNFANALAPLSVVQNQDVFINLEYNENLEQRYLNEGGPESPELVSRYFDTGTNINLDRVYFLTTKSSASASELLITGLSPYLDVIVVGTNTFGKFYGAYVLTGTRATPPNNYAIAPVTLKYANAAGVTDFVDGLEPDIEVREDIFDTSPLGDPSDPLLGAALQHIKDGVVSTKQVAPTLDYSLLPDLNRIKKGSVLFIKEIE